MGGGGVTPTHLKKVDFFFRQNGKKCKKNTRFALNIIFIKIVFLYCHPCLSTGSKEILIKREKKKLIFFFFCLQGSEFGGEVP